MNLQNYYSIEKKEDFQILIHEKKMRDKKRLINIFQRHIEELEDDNKETISEVYSYISEDTYEFNKEKKDNINKCCKCLMINFIFPLYSMFYLFGIFLVISIKDLLFNLLISSIECKLDIFCDKEKFKKQTNFFDYFLNEQNKVSVDLNLVMFWSFIGIKFVYLLGYTITTISFLILNLIVFSIVYIFDFQAPEDNYDFIKIVSLAILCFFMCLTLGSSSLISQQILINLYAIFYSDEDEIQDNNNNIDDLIIDERNRIEYINEINNEINNEIDESNENNQIIKNMEEAHSKGNIEKKNKDRGINNASNEKEKALNAFPLVCFTTVLAYFQKNNISISLLYHENENSNHTEKNETNQTDLIYFLQDNFTNITNENQLYRYNERTMFLFFCAAYIICCIVSILVYKFFTCILLVKKEKIKKRNPKSNYSKCFEICCIWKYFFEIFNCNLYIESTAVESENKKGNCKLCGETIKNYCNNCYCKCCCCKYNKDDFDKNSQFFCYCYEEKGCFEWIDNFLSNDIQKELLPLMMIYFLSKLVIIGSERDLIYSNENNSFNAGEKLVFIWYVLLCSLFFGVLNKKKTEPNKKLSEIMMKEFLNILFIECIFTIFVKYIIKKELNFNNTYIVFIINRLCLFSFNYYCITISKYNGKKEILLSQSTLIVIYFFLINKIVDLIVYILGDDLNHLYNAQIVFSSIIGFFLLTYNIYKLCKCCTDCYNDCFNN